MGMNPANAQAHFNGKSHKAQLREQRDAGAAWHKGCGLCGIESFQNEAAWIAHSNGKRHRRQVAFETHAANANKHFDNLDQLNAWLVQFGKQPQRTKTQAVKALKSVHVNIIDLLEGRPKLFSSVTQLAAYTRHSEKTFPRERAKTDGLKVFLRHLR